LLNASVGVQRVLGRVRRSSIDSMTAIPTIRPRMPARASRSRYGYRASPHLYPAPRRRRRTFVLPSFSFDLRSLAIHRPSVRGVSRALPRATRHAFATLGHERIVAIATAAIVLSASFLSVAPGGPSGDTGGPSGDGDSPRLAIAGSVDGDDVGSVEEDYVTPDLGLGEGGEAGTLGHPDLQPAPIGRFVMSDIDAVNRAGIALTLSTKDATIAGPYLDDGTLVKPFAVDTTVPDGSDLLKTYRVKSGDTLATIADHFNVSTMTLWWANDLKAKDRLVVGQRLRIPPVSGLVVEVTPSDTLPLLASKYKVPEQEILTTNGLEDRNLVVGQVLMLPGALGKGIVTPKAPKTTVSSPTKARPSGPRPAVRPPRTYSGGNMGWPTSSRHISQYYHYGHYGIDIDGSTGDPIFAAASGTVTFAGWKNNGGGYQVWVAHGSGLYTTYNHMSSVSVGRGQHVGRGQRVGRMGSTGFATGSHLHFEVWKGRIWDGGRRVNPLAYL
jgi:murein DD-endopeptidase MepM/ murein hydrolase activator NlpD